MEETISLVLHGCKLAKDLEQSLQNQQQVDMVYKSCSEINRVFASAVERLILMQQQINPAAGRPVVGSSSTRNPLEIMMSDETVGGSVVPVADSGWSSMLTASTSSHRSVRRRKNEGQKGIIRVRAPPGGNAELPPDDNYTWRKYGQKEILGSIYPRAYYRCTHQKLYNCRAKKQVQRMDTDFHTFQVTYIGDHTCDMSATAPSIPPPPQPSSDTTSQGLYLTPVPHHWLSMDFNIGPSGSTAVDTSSGGAGPSTARYNYSGVEELADVMFNSGSNNGGNSMDFIFSTVDHRWEPGGKKHD